jgi:hypothetical protein
VASSDGQLGEEVHLGGPDSLTWREVAEAYGRVLGVRVRTLRQPLIVYRALSFLARRASPAAVQIFVSQAIAATVDSAYPPDDVRRLLRREPTSVEAFLRQRAALPADGN